MFVVYNIVIDFQRDIIYNTDTRIKFKTMFFMKIQFINYSMMTLSLKNISIQVELTNPKITIRD